MKVSRLALPCLFALALPAAGRGAVTGKFVLDGKPVAAGEVAAFRVRDQFNPRQFETYVMLTATPVDKSAIAADFDPYAKAINDPAANADYIAFSVDAKGEVGMNAHVGGVQYIDSSGVIMGERGSLTASCKENSATRIACSVKTAKPVKSMDGPAWSVDVTFDSDVLARTPGKPLPAGGGDPGKAFLALRSAVPGKDLAKIVAHLSPEEAADYQADYRSPEENLKWATEMLDMRLPKKAKITAGESLADDHALLEVEGEPYENGRMLYLVEMKRVEGRWVYAASSPVGMLK